jgi:hypothetical protein
LDSKKCVNDYYLEGGEILFMIVTQAQLRQLIREEIEKQRLIEVAATPAATAVAGVEKVLGDLEVAFILSALPGHCEDVCGEPCKTDATGAQRDATHICHPDSKKVEPLGDSVEQADRKLAARRKAYDALASQDPEGLAKIKLNILKKIKQQISRLKI